MRVCVGCIVEGHGEVAAVPVLLRRIAAEVDPALAVHVPPPLRVPRARLVKTGELERSVELLARQLGGQGAILVIVDSDDDCPAQLGPALLERISSTRSDMACAAVLAKTEFEAWFLAAAHSLRGERGLSKDLGPPADPENIRGAKEWLSKRMEGSRAYSETLDQPALAARFDLVQARSAPSFHKCCRDVRRLLDELRRV